jgi:hypothetical protein
MTNKIYKSAQGKSVDLGTIMLQNEHVRAVGNMKVNARGDKIDSANRVIETKAQQIQKQNNRTTTNVSSDHVHTSSRKNRRPVDNTVADQVTEDPVVVEEPAPVVIEAPTPVEVPAPVVAQAPAPAPVQAPAQPKQSPAPAKTQTAPVDTPKHAPTVGGGLAGAIARTREIKQELDKTRRQQAQAQGVRKI